MALRLIIAIKGFLFLSAAVFLPPACSTVNAFVQLPKTKSAFQRQSYGSFAALDANLRTTAIVRPLSMPSTLETSTLLPVIDNILHQPILWSTIVMATIVALLSFWEAAVESMREETPPALLPVIESMLGEIGGIGFIGLVLQISLGSTGLGNWIGHISEVYLGEEEILLESFEFLHTAFFQVAIGFFVFSGITVATVLTKLQQIRKISGLEVNNEGECTATPSTLADILDAPKMSSSSINQVDDSMEYEKNTGKNIFAKELSMGLRERGAEFLLIRERFLDQYKIPDEFHYDLECLFATYLKELVEIRPLVWLPLIPALAVANALDLSHEVVNAASPNAYASSGYFFSTPIVFYPNLLWQIFSLTLSVAIFWKMASIKRMMLPILARDATTCEVRLLAPQADSNNQISGFDSSPGLFRLFESFFAEPAKTRHDRLYGVAGGAGPELYLKLIKYNTWLSVSAIVFFATQIIPRDWMALNHPELAVGDPNHLVPELIAFSIFVAMNIFQLILTPTTFLNYCLANFGRDKVMEEAAGETILRQGLEIDAPGEIEQDLSGERMNIIE